MNIKYNEFGEVVSVNGLITGQHIGMPMQDALGTPDTNCPYAEEMHTVTSCGNTVDDKQPENLHEGVECIVLKSCTPGSKKRFKVTVDDSGSLSVVHTDVVLATDITGTWLLNDDAMYAPTDGLWFRFPFVLNRTNGFGFGYSDFYETLVWEYDIDGDGNRDGEEQMSTGSGINATLTTSATVDSVENGEALLAWLNANATKIA